MAASVEPWSLEPPFHARKLRHHHQQREKRIIERLRFQVSLATLGTYASYKTTSPIELWVINVVAGSSTTRSMYSILRPLGVTD